MNYYCNFFAYTVDTGSFLHMHGVCMKRNAFTLVELLVVVAIIALIAGLALPATARAIAAAKRTACASNMRQIGIAILAYANERDGDFPRSSHTDAQESWIFTLAPYLGNVDDIRICPADPRARERRELKSSSYLLNEFICVPATDPFGAVVESFSNLNDLHAPSRTLVAFIGADNMGLGQANDHTHSRGWAGWNNVIQDISPDRHRVGASAPDHSRGQSNYLYADGHVETIDAKAFKALVDSGVNPARPPKP